MKILTQEQAKNYQIPSLNRGHIVFTSLIQFKQKILFLDSHIERLLKGAVFLFPDVHWEQDHAAIKRAVEEALKESENAYLRLTIFDDVLYMEKRPLETSPASVKLTSAVKIKTPDLCPAFLKQSNYLEADLELKQAKANGFDDVLFFDHLQHAAEASTSNLFIVTAEGNVKTPPACSYVLQGITREKLSECLKKGGTQVLEQPVTKAELEKAKEIWLTNAVRGVRFVSQFQEKQFQSKGSYFEEVVKLFGRYGENYE